jgi:hypothetical protein
VEDEMTDRLLVHAKNADQLAEVDGVLHDSGFSMLDVTYDESLGLVRIPFRGIQKTRDLLAHKARRDDPEPASQAAAHPYLEISHVKGLAEHDPDGLIEHSYSRLECSQAGSLILKSNFPGSVDLEVSEIDVQVKV